MKNTFYNERVGHLAGLQNWPNTQVPITGLVTEFIPELCKLPYDYLYRDDPKAMAECTLLIQEYINFDLIIANMDIYNFEAENIGAKLRFYKDACPDIDRSEYFIKDEEDLDKLKFQGMDAGRMHYLVDFVKHWEACTGFPIDFAFSAPWTLAANLYGLDNLVCATIEDPEFVHEMLRRIVEDIHLPMFTALKKELPSMSAISLADAFAAPPMTTPDICDAFITPYVDMENKLLAPHGMSVTSTAYFGAGRLQGAQRTQYEEFVAHCNQAQFYLDPDADIVGVDYVRQRADELGVLLHTGLQASYVEFGKPEEIAKKAKKYTLTIRKGLTPGFFWIANVGTRCPIENIMAATQTCRVYGAPGASEDTPMPEISYLPFEEFLKNKIANNEEGYTFDWLKKSGYSYLL